MRIYLKGLVIFLLFTFVNSSWIFCQNSGGKQDLNEVSIGLQDVLGNGFDLREVDPKSWITSSKGRPVVMGTSKKSIISSNESLKFHFITTPYEYERDFLKLNNDGRPYQAFKSNAYFKPWETADSKLEQLFAYAQLEYPLYIKRIKSNQIQLDSALVADFNRLGRDITPEGFVHRYGTHYAKEVVYGGRFINRYTINPEDFIYSPYDRNTFKEKVKLDILASQNGQEDADPYIHSGKAATFTIGGNINVPNPNQWAQTVAQNEQPIDVTLASYSELFRQLPLTQIENKMYKISLLDSITASIKTTLTSNLKEQLPSPFYKKYSLRFEQTLNAIVKKASGNDEENDTQYTGDLFFGGYSKDDAILKSRPFIDYGDLRLETLITDETLQLDRSVIINIKPEDIERGYVSVWDDTKKLFKSKERTTLRVSGREENKTRYLEALTKNITKTVVINTVDKDIYEISYSLKLLKENAILKNLSTTYNYVIATQLTGAASTGDQKRLEELFKQNGNTTTKGIIEALIINKHSNDMLNFVLNQGVIPSKDDLDLLFVPEYFDEQKALILLERGAKPKNNLVFKAVAYKSANTIYALLREGATPQNNDLAFAIEKYHYPTIKALMSREFEAFEAGKKELLLAVENNDSELAQKFINLGATVDAHIFARAAAQENEILRNTIVAVTEASGETLEVAAHLDDTNLFNYL